MESVQRFPFCLHPNVRIKPEHPRGDMSGDAHNRLVARLSFGQLCNRMVPEAVKAQPGKWALDATNISPAFLIATSRSGLLELPASWTLNCLRDARARLCARCSWA